MCLLLLTPRVCLAWSTHATWGAPFSRSLYVRDPLFRSRNCRPIPPLLLARSLARSTLRRMSYPGANFKLRASLFPFPGYSDGASGTPFARFSRLLNRPFNPPGELMEYKVRFSSFFSAICSVPHSPSFIDSNGRLRFRPTRSGRRARRYAFLLPFDLKESFVEGKVCTSHWNYNAKKVRFSSTPLHLIFVSKHMGF